MSFFYYPLGSAGGGAVSPLSVRVSPNPAEFYKPSVYYSASVDVEAKITGGREPFTAIWSYVSGDTEITPASFTTIENTFTASNDSAAPVVYEAVWQVEITDADSNTATATVDVLLAFGTAIP